MDTVLNFGNQRMRLHIFTHEQNVPNYEVQGYYK
jgi:hypothetical protein